MLSSLICLENPHKKYSSGRYFYPKRPFVEELLLLFVVLEEEFLLLSTEEELHVTSEEEK